MKYLTCQKWNPGKMELDINPIKFSEIITQINATFSEVAKNKYIEFSIKNDLGANASIHTDRQRLEQILKNLLSNAFKFTPERVKYRSGSARRQAGPSCVRLHGRTSEILELQTDTISRFHRSDWYGDTPGSTSCGLIWKGGGAGACGGRAATVVTHGPHALTMVTDVISSRLGRWPAWLQFVLPVGIGAATAVEALSRWRSGL